MNTEHKPWVQKAYLWFYVIFVLTPPGLLLLLYASVGPDDNYGLQVGLGLIFSMFFVLAIPVGLVVTLSYMIISPTWATAFFIAQALGILIIQFLGIFNILSSLPGIYLVFLLCIQYVVFFTTVFRMLPKAN